MSTKIYRGFKVLAPTFTAAYNLLDSLRPEVAKMSKLVQDQYITNHTVDLIDRTALGESLPGADSPRWTAQQHLWDEQKELKSSNRRNVSVDTDFELSLFPQIEDHIIGIAFTEQNVWYKWFTDQPFIESFGYWDNSDPDDNVSPEAWEERRQVWDRVFEKNNSPAECGVTFQLHPVFVEPTSPERVLELAPSLSKRIEERAKRLLMSERMAELASIKPVDDYPSEFMQRWKESAEWLRTDPEGQTRLVAKRALVSDLLPELTRDVIERGITSIVGTRMEVSNT